MELSTKKYIMVGICIMLVVSIFTVTLAETASANTLGSRTLRQGSRGGDVSELQARLNRIGFWSGSIDGIFGPLTRSGVVGFQRARGLLVDGIVGPQTFGALGVNASPATVAVASRGVSSNDMDLLARLVSAEAKGEIYTGQVAVAAVVLNRVKSPNFPNSIQGVVFDRYQGLPQFSPIDDGSIWQAATESSKRAVRDAVNGWDPGN